jgi:ubiquinone/menaquinone biosynthesis C-methylase UbiE
MSNDAHIGKLEMIYERIWSTHRGDLFAKLDQSLNPRSPDLLFDVVGRLNIRAGSTALDVGCGRGNHAIELARRFTFQVTGIDPIESNLVTARHSLSETGLDGRVTFAEGSVEELPFENMTFDLVWCRDMLIHVPDLRRGISECGRVLKPDGHMMVYTTYATGLLEPKEAASLCERLGLVSQNLSSSHVEQSFKDSSLQIISGEVIGGELMEYYEERENRCTKELMRLARMIRAKEQLMAEMGRENYEVATAVYRWIIYHLIGKLSSTIYTLKRVS